MKQIFAIIRKDALIRFASPWEWVFFIILPVVFTFLVAGGTPNGEGDSRIRLLVADEAHTNLSQQITDALQHSSAVRPEIVTRAEGQKQFDARRASILLILPANLDLLALQNGQAEVELLQQPNNLDALVAERAILTAIRSVSGAVGAANSAVIQHEKASPFAGEAEKQAYFDEAFQTARRLQNEAPQRVAVVESLIATEEVDYGPRANASAGQLITWVFVQLFGISGLFVYERQQGTLRRLLITPSSKAIFLLGTILGQVFFALLQMSLLVLFGMFVMKLQWGRDPLVLAALLSSAALAGAALGTTLGTFVKSPGQASGLSVMFGMVMALLGGCWYPLELFPKTVQAIVRVLPTTWAMQGMLDLVLRGGGLAEVLPKVGVLLGFAAVFFVIGIWRFRYE